MKLKHILLAAVVPAVAFLASCGGSDEKVVPAPTCTFQTGSGYTSSDVTSFYDSTVKIGVRAFSNDQSLTGVKITLSTNGAAAGSILDSVLSVKTCNFDYTYKVKGGVGDKQLLTVTATDKNGKTASASLTITINPALVAIVGVSAQKVYNVLAPSGFFGAYDLYGSVGVASASTETSKDLKDLTVATGPNAAVFTKSWGSGNGSKFIKVTANDWNNATNSDAIWQLWQTNGASATTTVTNIANNDVIVVKTGQAISFNLYIIKITDVHETPTPANGGDNNDYIQFDYKGVTQ